MKTIWQKNKELERTVAQLECEKISNGKTIDTLRFIIKEYYKKEKALEIARIVKNGKATIVWFADGEKVVVKKCATDKPSVYSAVAFAIVKRMYGNNSHFQSVVDNLLKGAKK